VTPLLDPITIAQLGNLKIRARRILDGLYSGHHLNRNRGQSKEFSEHRAYYPGDDLKGLDWKVLARTDRLMVKQFDEESSLVGLIVIDDSASMNFSWAGRLSKLEYVKTMAAALGYLLVSQHDGVGLLSTREMIRPQAGKGMLENFFERLTALQAQGVWDLASLISSPLAALKRRGLLIVFSDLMQQDDQVIASLRALHIRKFEVIVFQVLDPAEMDLPFTGSIRFEDLESGEKVTTEPEAIRQDYRRLVRNRLTHFSQMFRSSGIEHHVLTTGTPFDQGLGSYLSWRAARL